MSTEPSEDRDSQLGSQSVDAPNPDSSEATAPVVELNIANSAQRTKWLIGLGAALAILLMGGVAHGILSNRWGVPEDILALGSKLQEIPKQIGPWKCSSEAKLEPTVETMLEAKGYLSRVYTHESTGESVNVFVVFGPKGPIAVHTPEVCYSARAVTQTSDRTPIGVESEFKEGSLWKLGFETNTIDKQRMSVHYGWSEGGPWTAANNPRFWRTDYLYKIQTSCLATGKKEDSTDEFFKFFLPELRKQMRSIGG